MKSKVISPIYPAGPRLLARPVPRGPARGGRRLRRLRRRHQRPLGQERAGRRHLRLLPQPELFHGHADCGSGTQFNETNFCPSCVLKTGPTCEFQKDLHVEGR